MHTSINDEAHQSLARAWALLDSCSHPYPLHDLIDPWFSSTTVSEAGP